MRRRAILLGLALPLLLAVAWPARASVMLALDLPALVRSADVVVVADVVGQTARWDAHRRIVTDVGLAVVEPLKGTTRAGDVVVLARLGGAIGDLGMRVEGEPMFDDGDRVLVLARVSADGSLRAVGMSQGVMLVDHAMVQPGANGLALVQPGSDGRLRPAPAALIAPRPLADVRSEILALVGSAR